MSWTAVLVPRIPPAPATQAGPQTQAVALAVTATLAPAGSQATWQRGMWSWCPPLAEGLSTGSLTSTPYLAHPSP